MKKNNKSLISLTIVLLMLPLTTLVVGNEQVLSTPPTIEGPVNCITGRVYTYTIILNEPDNCFLICWGDENEYKVGPYQSGIPINVEHVWSQSGIFVVKAVSANQEGHVSEFSEYFYVTVKTSPTSEIYNIPPKAPNKVDGPETLNIEETGTYTTITQDINFDDLTYVFNWGDNSEDIIGPLSPGQSAVLSHSWVVPGTYPIDVMAIDTHGSSSQWSEVFYVNVIGEDSESNNRPETPPRVSGESMCTLGEVYTYTVSTTDPDGDDLYYIFFWGRNTNNRDIVGPYSSGETVSIEHMWTEQGIFDIVIMAIDTNGAMSSPSPELLVHVFSNNINNPPDIPTISGETVCLVGETYTYKILGSDIDEEDKLFYRIDWDDGNVDFLGPYNLTELVYVEHTWNDIGKYWISVTAIDKDGSSTTSNHALCVYVLDSEPSENTPPTIPSRIYGPSMCTVGDMWGYSTKSFDVDGDSITYTFYWGDGTIDTVTRSEGQTVLLTHSWEYVGIFGVRVSACDGVNPETSCSPELIIHVFPEEDEDNNAAPNQPSLSGEDNCIVGETYTYSATTIDPDGDDITYTFIWDNKTTTTEGPVASGVSVSVDHLWNVEGIFQVTVIAKDINNKKSPLSRQLSVKVVEPANNENMPPTEPTIVGPTEDVPLGESISYKISSTDSDGDKIYFRYWIYGSSGGPLQEGLFGPYNSSETVNLVVVWETSGKNSITVQAIDEYDHKSYCKLLNVNVIGSVPPNAPDIWCSSGHNGKEKRDMLFTFYSRDPDKDNIRYYIDWGDGNTEETNWVIYGDERVIVHHTYQNTGSYTVKAMAIDSNNMESEWSSDWYVSITKEKSRNNILYYFPVIQRIHNLLETLFGY